MTVSVPFRITDRSEAPRTLGSQPRVHKEIDRDDGGGAPGRRQPRGDRDGGGRLLAAGSYGAYWAYSGPLSATEERPIFAAISRDSPRSET